ncbi:hypothetical protein [Phenylobacterium sp.]|uniref:hypothetical protein n=1 Tax=Phenylobacterium sp. TaxID=1871053 RepID=UPI002FDAF3EE
MTNSAYPPAKSRRRAGWGRRGEVALRTLMAIGLGYALSALATTALAHWLPGSRLERTVTATLLSFAIFVALVIWAFATPRLSRALGLGLMACFALAALNAWGAGR